MNKKFFTDFYSKFMKQLSRTSKLEQKSVRFTTKLFPR